MVTYLEISKYLDTRSERLDFLNTTLRFKGQKTEGEENRGDLTCHIGNRDRYSTVAL